MTFSYYWLTENVFNTKNACSMWSFISAVIPDDFGVYFVVPTILYLGDMVAVLILVKYILLLFVS